MKLSDGLLHEVQSLLGLNNAVNREAALTKLLNELNPHCPLTRQK